MVEIFQGGTLIAATITMGLSAGLFYAFSISVMLGLRRTDDRTFVDVMQRINVAILNGWFAIGFVGALVFTAATAILNGVGDARPALPWIVAALVLYGLTLAITFTVNVPLNNELDAAGEPDRIVDIVATRDRFEARWVRWNVVRAVTSTAALALLTWALVLHGRAT
jgi:uncharacterized membrane protein